METSRPKWDLFCIVVDNFGDIGVTWRLAKEISRKGKEVRIFLDKVCVLSKIENSINPELKIQTTSDNITIIQWNSQTDFKKINPADVIVEMFACSLPNDYIQQIKDKNLWINLEYLSAENWVEDCHGMKSMEQGKIKYFFFPGFSKKTGGINFESDQITKSYHHSKEIDNIFSITEGFKQPNKNQLLISAFTYENANMAQIICKFDYTKLFKSYSPVFIVPESIFLNYLLSNFKKLINIIPTEFSPNNKVKVYQCNNQAIIISTPMVSQNDYDEILRRCNLNFIRGEDSFIRAQMAEKPFIWHIYPQDENAHIEKLQAFIEKYTKEFSNEDRENYENLSIKFNQTGEIDLLKEYSHIINRLDIIKAPIINWRNSLINNGSLAFNLIKFAESH